MNNFILQKTLYQTHVPFVNRQATKVVSKRATSSIPGPDVPIQKEFAPNSIFVGIVKLSKPLGLTPMDVGGTI